MQNERFPRKRNFCDVKNQPNQLAMLSHDQFLENNLNFKKISFFIYFEYFTFILSFTLKSFLTETQ